MTTIGFRHTGALAETEDDFASRGVPVHISHATDSSTATSGPPATPEDKFATVRHFLMSEQLSSSSRLQSWDVEMNRVRSSAKGSEAHGPGDTSWQTAL